MKAVLVTALILSIGLAGCHQRGASPEPASAPLRVKTMTTVAREVASTVPVGATVRAVKRAAVSAQIMAAIRELPVELGQSVTEGELLLRLEGAEYRARLERARTEVRAAKRDLERETQLQAKGASTVEIVRSQADVLAGAEAAVREAEAQVAYTELRAPFSGRVVEKAVKVGDFASPGRTLLVLEEDGALEVTAAVPSSLVPALRPGAEICIENSDTRLIVRELSPAADTATRTVEVKLRPVGDFPYHSGDYVVLAVPSGSSSAVLTVPQSAVVRRGQMEYVWVVKPEGRLSLRVVRTGREFDGHWVILSGLAAGEAVVLSPSTEWSDGASAEAMP